ncbi:hypothetical protein [Actinomadura logoneensis]|uniref:hypothetical protein n=1 Tax=Actinomadura logoneensis TaxID=2293572 RepID=UPI0022A7AEE2|nr:hypothetical protein [Actinomadura logoneensis]
MGSTATALVTGGTAVLTGALTAVVGVVTARLGHTYERHREADARAAERSEAAERRVREALRSMDDAVVDLGVTVRLCERLRSLGALGEDEELAGGKRVSAEYRTAVREIQGFLDAVGHDPRMAGPVETLRAEVRRAWLHGLGDAGKQDPRSAAAVDEELQRLMGDVGRALAEPAAAGLPLTPAPARPPSGPDRGAAAAGAGASVPAARPRAARRWRRWRSAPPTRRRERPPR